MVEILFEQFSPAPLLEFVYFAEILRRALIYIERHSSRANYGAIRLGGFVAAELQYIPRLLWSWPIDYTVGLNPMRHNISRVPEILRELDSPEDIIEDARHIFLLETGIIEDSSMIDLPHMAAPAIKLWKYIDITVESLLVMRTARNIGLSRFPIQGSAFGVLPHQRSALRDAGRTNVLLAQLISDIPLTYSNWPSFSEDDFNFKLMRMLPRLPSQFARFVE